MGDVVRLHFVPFGSLTGTRDFCIAVAAARIEMLNAEVMACGDPNWSRMARQEADRHRLVGLGHTARLAEALL